MTPHPIRPRPTRRFVRYAVILCAVLPAATISHPVCALTVLLGTYTLQQDEMHASVTIGPLATVNTNGHTLTINGNGGLYCLSLLLTGGHLYIQSTTQGPGRVVLSGSASHFIGAHGAVELMDSTARLEIATVDATVSGGGQIIGRHPDATISIALGRKLTSRLTVIGAMTIAGPGTFRNEALLSAMGSYSTNAKITLAEDLNLEDDANSLWDASAAELEFNHAQTDEAGLAGNISMRALGALNFRASVDCETFLWLCGTLSVGDDATLTYQQFTLGVGKCENPDASGPPYVITGPFGLYCPFCSTGLARSPLQQPRGLARVRWTG